MNKILYTLTFLLLANYSNAQTYTQQRDSLFQYLNPELVPTGVLYDRVFPWAELTADTLELGPVSYDYALQAWYELELASYDQGNMLTLEMAKTLIRKNTDENRGISIGIIDYEFNSIDSTAIDRGSLVYDEDNLLHQVDENIYLHHRLTLPLVSIGSVQGEDVKFYFDPYLTLNNTGRVVERIEMTLEEGGEILTITPGEEATLHIAGIEDSIIRASFRIYFESVLIPGEFTVEWHNGNLIPMNASFNSDKCTSGEEPIDIFSGTGLVFQGYDENSASQGMGEYKVFYRQSGGDWGTCANTLDKPIIIIDGFDPGDQRWITQRQYNGETVNGIWELLAYGSGKHLGDEMRKKGYDVIILNFPTYQSGTRSITVPPYSLPIYRDGGADYIERNARVLVKLIQEVNDKLQQAGSTEKVVVVGPSMGGQIARSALAYMEKEGMNHNTRLYVSFDSPHKGANIPMAGQQALYHLGVIVNQAAAKESYNNQIRSVAAKQMLIEQMDGLNKGSWFFNKYYTDLQNGGLSNSQGWPMNLKKISLINGNANGTNTNAAGAKILGLKANALAGAMRGLELDLFNMPNTSSGLTTYEGKVRGGGLFYLGTGTSVTNFIFNNNPNMWGSNIRSFIGLVFGITTDKGTISLSNQNSNGVMDVVPGGTYNTVEVLYRQIDKMLRDMGIIKNTSIEWKDLKFKHSFIPSVSSLAFKNTNFNWSTPFNNRDLVCTGEIPFDAYFSAPGNEDHVSLTEASAKWVMEEIDKGGPNCPTICKNGIQVGNDLTNPLCLGNTRSFAHNYNMPPGATATWSIADNPYELEILWSNNYSVTVKALEDYDNAVIRYTINNPCGANIEGSFTITVGTPMSGYRLYAYSSSSNGAKVQNFNPQTNSYSWGYDGGSWMFDNMEYYPGTFPVSTNYNPNAPHLCLRTVNACGTDIDCKYPYLPAAPLNAKLAFKVTAYPNPASSYWNVTLPMGKTWQLGLYNSMGILVWSKKSSDMSEIIPAEQLASGMYMLKIHTRDETQTLKLIKQ